MGFALASLLVFELSACTSFSAYPLPLYSGQAKQPISPGADTPMSAGAGAPVGAGAATRINPEAAAPIMPAPAPIAGNEVRLLIDGPASFDAMFASIKAARSRVDLQTYIFDDDELGWKMAKLLIHKRAQGVDVNLIYDSIGSVATPGSFFEHLRAAGVKVCEFNPVNPTRSTKSLNAPDTSWNHRSHRKILAVDGAVAFTGGINVSGVYRRGSSFPTARSMPPADPTREGWRDTQIEIRGPAAARLQRVFAQTWHQQQCEPRLSPLRRPTGQVTAGRIGVTVIASSPDDADNLIYRQALTAMREARESIKVTMAYFVPDQQTIDIMSDAARRGVAVSLILPGVTESKTVLSAGRAFYDDLLTAGVTISERKDALLHAKTIVIDDHWSMVGSANMDWRSFTQNDEISVIIDSRVFAADMGRMFDDDLTRATPITLDQWRDRGVTERMAELWGQLWSYWL